MNELGAQRQYRGVAICIGNGRSSKCDEKDDEVRSSRHVKRL